MEFLGSASGASFITRARRRPAYDDSKEFKSKNLNAERRRREKLSSRLLTLRSLMNKATIIEDAISYIEALQRDVKVLSDQLLEMESSSEEREKPRIDEINAAEEMKKNGIEEDVQVTKIDGKKIWMKIIFEKKRGRFTKLLEAMTYLGFEMTDTNVTTYKGAILLSACVERTYGGSLEVEETWELILQIIRGI
ncbi:hypothetical protein JRO89_XS06G0094500 [Xanthoceras sorbifolium]|uniref:BHLH domain-containing protein n=1 Tax=Xanthoceras sorbifolium TaxID=99658 RepID=A0ABQ8HXU6_9ROSI|nr:hypothetical protein JRO89_XS06G0094500 [Xanthoceras sorbifolium]